MDPLLGDVKKQNKNTPVSSREVEELQQNKQNLLGLKVGGMFFGKVKVMFRKGGVLYGELVKEREERSLYIHRTLSEMERNEPGGFSFIIVPSS